MYLQTLHNRQGHWQDILKFKQHPQLGVFVNLLPGVIKSAKSNATNQKYDGYFKRFKVWCLQHNFQPLPASVATVSLFLTSLVQQRVSSSVLEAFYYSINWIHSQASCINPCEEKFLKLTLEGGKRILAKPVNKKEPITIDILLKLKEEYQKDPDNALKLRVFLMCLLGFSGFLRFSELSNIRLCDIKWKEAYIEINIPKSKTDIYRRGNVVIIAKTGNDMCPIFWLKKYISLLQLNVSASDYLFTAITYKKSLGGFKVVNASKPLSYTRAREILLSALSNVGLDGSQFSLHSVRSGGATAASNNNVPDRLLKVHGRWASDKAKDGYIDDSIQKKLLVSMNLGL